MKKIGILIIVFLFLTCHFVSTRSIHSKNISLSENLMKNYFSDDNEIINEYTWSVMRYDHVSMSDNFGPVSMPKPTPGPIIIPMNMMSKEVCKVAINLYRENKTETLNALEKFDFDNMVVGFPYILWHMWASKNNMPCLGQKISAQEMYILGNRFPWANLVGDCYSQSLFNTAILRLCGFSSEEVFTVTIPMHAIVVVKLEEKWLIFDSVNGQFTKNSILDSINPPSEDIIYWLENDKYFINFGTLSAENWPYQEDPYSNIDTDVLIDIVSQIIPLLNNSKLGRNDWNIYEFIENASACPDIITVGMPYTIKDAFGNTIDEKAESLIELNKKFIIDQIGVELLNQYDRSIYGLGLLSVEYPQAYANAAKYGLWTSRIAKGLDSNSPKLDYFKTALWVNFMINNKKSLTENYVIFSDFSYICLTGSSIDQAIVAYGTMRNMKKYDNLWQAEDLYVLVTEDSKGYLAINTAEGWKYLNFETGKLVSNNPPKDIEKAFNEKEYLNSWDN
jgi:hypothetical protein